MGPHQETCGWGWQDPRAGEHGGSLQVVHGCSRPSGWGTQGLPAGGPWGVQDPWVGEHGGLPAGGPWQGTAAGQPGLASGLSKASVSSLGKYEKSSCLAGYGEGVRELMKGSKGSQ